jgi:hypothetical protein
MKNITVLMIVLITSLGCKCTKKTASQTTEGNEKTMEKENTTTTKNDFILEYTANTRGFYQKTTIKNEIMAVSRDRSGIEKEEEIQLSKADWSDLVAAFNKTNLEELNNLKAPTEKRFYDGAAIANLKITVKENNYETQPFDHGFPPVEIKELVDKITTLSKKE